MCTDKNNDENKMNLPHLPSTPITVLLISEKLLTKFSGFQFASYSKYVINSGMRQNSILIPLFFFYLDCLPDDALLILSKLMILLSTDHMTNHLTCRNKLGEL